MNQLLGASVTRRVAGIKCTPYMVFPLTRMLTLIQARSFINCKVSEFPVGGNLRMDETGRQRETDFLSFFTKEGKAQRDTGDRTEIYHGPVFTGDVEKRYLDYLGTFDWESLQKHMIDYPRRRSEAEVRLIFDKWAAYFGRKYPSAELKEMRFPTFKEKLAMYDKVNSKGQSALALEEKDDISCYPVSCYPPYSTDYWVKGFRIPYRSFTRPDFCELSGTYDDDYYSNLIKKSGERWPAHNQYRM